MKTLNSPKPGAPEPPNRLASFLNVLIRQPAPALRRRNILDR